MLDDVARFKRLEQRLIPEGLDYRNVPGLSTEIRERLAEVRPRSLGQASRVPGVTPAAISILTVWCHRARPAGAGRRRAAGQRPGIRGGLGRRSRWPPP